MDSGNLQSDVAEVPLVQSDPGEIKRAIAHHGAVSLKGGASDPKTFVDLLGQLGPLMFTAGETPIAPFEGYLSVS
jgi:alpha-ketoglutarate-dependent taurine dioxygenase